MGRKLYVGNLSFSATEESLKEAFSKCGAVESVVIVTDRDTGQSKGFGFIEMASDQEAADAVGKMNNAGFEGRTLRVSIALPQAPRGSSGPQRGHGGGRGGFRR
jgi:RNA recognition motif-containing protein